MAYNLGKTEAMFMEKNHKKIRPVSITLDEIGQAIEMKSSLKYLGVVFGSRLNFVEHMKSVRKKSQRLANRLSYLAKVTYGRKGKIIKQITDRVMKSAILYGSEILGSKAKRALITNNHH